VPSPTEGWRAAGNGPSAKAGFTVTFDASIPKERASTSSSGPARAQRLQPVTAVARRDGRSIDRVYWLEVLLAPLALAGGGM
jgi:hypothetical protein